MDRAPGLSVRLKLTLSYAGFLMLAGVLMLAAVWMFYLRRLPMTPNRITILPSNYLVMRHFAPTAGIVLAFLLVFGLLGGWILADRMLAPLTRITDATRTAATGSLSHRIRLPGRKDEFRELADAFDTMLAQLEAHVSERRSRVAKHGADELGYRDVRPFGETRRTMPQVMEPDGRQASAVGKCLEAHGGPLRRHRGAVLASEDEAGLWPARAPREPVLYLHLAPGPQGGDHNSRQRNRADPGLTLWGPRRPPSRVRMQCPDSGLPRPTRGRALRHAEARSRRPGRTTLRVAHLRWNQGTPRMPGHPHHDRRRPQGRVRPYRLPLDGGRRVIHRCGGHPLVLRGPERGLALGCPWQRPDHPRPGQDHAIARVKGDLAGNSGVQGRAQVGEHAPDARW
jgi:HAMP domain-containing protein